MHFFAVSLKQKNKTKKPKKPKILIYWIKGPFLNYCMLEVESTMLGLGPIISHPPSGPHSILRRPSDVWASGILIGRRRGRGISFPWWLASLLLKWYAVWGSFLPSYLMHKDNQSPCLINSFLKHFIFITFSIIAIISVQGCIISGLDDWVSLPTCLISSSMALAMILHIWPKKKKKKSLSIANLIISLYSSNFWKAFVSFGLVALPFLLWSTPRVLFHSPAHTWLCTNSNSLQFLY